MGWDSTKTRSFLSLSHWTLRFKTKHGWPCQDFQSSLQAAHWGTVLVSTLSTSPTCVRVSQVGLQLLCSKQHPVASLLLWNPMCPTHGVSRLLLKGGTTPWLLPEAGMEKPWEAGGQRWHHWPGPPLLIAEAERGSSRPESLPGRLLNVVGAPHRVNKESISAAWPKFIDTLKLWSTLFLPLLHHPDRSNFGMGMGGQFNRRRKSPWLPLKQTKAYENFWLSDPSEKLVKALPVQRDGWLWLNTPRHLSSAYPAGRQWVIPRELLKLSVDLFILWKHLFLSLLMWQLSIS